MPEVNTRRAPAAVAALVGLLAVGAALAAGHLVAGFLGPASSPYFAVGNAAIDLTPAGVKGFAVSTFGTNDKTVLLAGMGVVLAVLGVAFGLVSRRRSWPGALLIGLLGILGVVAVYSRGGLGELAVLSPIVSMVVGVGIFLLLHALATRRRPAAVEGRESSESRAGRRMPSRRGFLASSAGVVAAGAAAGVSGQALAGADDARDSRTAIGALTPAEPAPPIPPNADFRKAGTPSFITPNRKFYRVDKALIVPQIRADDWRLRIHGMVRREKTFNYADIASRRLVERTITMTCVSNPVGGPYVSTAKFIGVPLAELLAEVGVVDGADQLFSTSHGGGYTAGTPVEAVTDPDRGALLAIGMNREALPLVHGFPARMVVPGIYGYASATKWVVDMELTTFAAKKAYWIPRGYSVRAPIKTESRIDAPTPFQRLPTGPVTVAGIAWAQTTGIAKVEVRIDGGPWQSARLATPVNRNTWRMWRAELTVGQAGSHTVEARASDANGHTQTPHEAPVLPDGASGWPSLVFDTT
jgi:DMSO/TMAO reductase YedYZ molybdopterin-dependent catalytic subunit